MSFSSDPAAEAPRGKNRVIEMSTHETRRAAALGAHCAVQGDATDGRSGGLIPLVSVGFAVVGAAHCLIGRIAEEQLQGRRVEETTRE